MKNFKVFLPVFVSLIMIVGGAILSISPIVEFSKRNFLGWKKTTAEVSGFTPISSESGERQNLTTLSYQIENSRFEVIRNDGARQPSFDESATVFYNPKKPSDAVIGDYPIWNLAILSLPIAGFILFFIALKLLKKPQTYQKFETEDDNISAISKMQNSEKILYGNIIDVESEVFPNGVSYGRAVVLVKLPDGRIFNFKSDKIEGLTAGMFVSYFANPTPISISLRAGDFNDYYINSDEILLAVKKSFEGIREGN